MLERVEIPKETKHSRGLNGGSVDYNGRISAICRTKTLNDRPTLFCADIVTDQIESVNTTLICLICITENFYNNAENYFALPK